jgi:hypothetical protein
VVRKRVLYFIMVLALVLCMALPTTTPVMASTIDAAKHPIPLLPNIYRIGDTIYYEMRVSNPVGNNASNYLTRIWDTLPGGQEIDFLNPGQTLIQAPGENATFYANYTVAATDVVWLPGPGYYGITNHFEAEGVNSHGAAVYVHRTAVSQIIQPDIHVEKYVWDGAGWQDADTATGPYLTATQDPVVFRFVVTNNGTVDLTDVSLIDTDIGAFYTEVACNNLATLPTTLAVSETKTYYGKLDWAAGQHNDVATATGTPPDGADVYDTDPANYFGGSPAIDLIKYVSVNNQTSWNDANSAPGPSTLVGNNVYFKFYIRNAGNVTLTGITLTDTVYNLAGITPALPASLAPGAEYNGIIGPIAATAGQHTNTATATGYWEGNPVSDSDPANYSGGNSAIDLIKYVSVNNQTSWDDANSAPGPGIPVGKNVYFKFYIRNTGSVTLTGITLTDTVYNLAGITPALPASIAPGAEYNGIIGPITATAGQHTNTATATGYWEGNPVSDVDPANYFGGNSAIDLIKYVSVDNQASWDDANSAPGPSILMGNDVYFKFYIKNTGNVTLTGITLTDSVYSLAGITPALPASLAPGAEYNGIIGPIAATGSQHTNTATATGYWEGNPISSDIDPANYYSGNAAIDLIKYVSVNNQTSWDDANSAPGPGIAAGEDVYFRFYIKNTGNVTLTAITLTDSVYSLAGITPALPASLAPGAEYNGIIGPIAATAGHHTNTGTATGYWEGSPVSDIDPANYLGPSGPVGWETYPVNKARVLLPWVGLLAAVIAGTSLLVLRRRRLT